MARETDIKKMMEACEQDPELQAKLLENPKEFAQKKFKVELNDQEVQQLLKVGQLMRLVDEFKAGRFVGPGPVTYPVDIWWKRVITNHVIRYNPLYYRLFYLIYYPIGYMFRMERPEMGSLVGLRRRMR
jgi:hypothetical protein